LEPIPIHARHVFFIYQYALPGYFMQKKSVRVKLFLENSHTLPILWLWAFKSNSLRATNFMYFI